MTWKWFVRSFQLICLFLALLCCSVPGSLADTLTAGSQFPQFTLPAPASAQEQSYLGLKTMGPFSLSDVRAKLLVVEFMSAT